MRICRVPILAVLLGLGVATGCASGNTDAGDREEMSADHSSLGYALNAYASALNASNSEPTVSAIAAATEPSQDALAAAADQWLEDSATWNLHESAGGGMPSRATVDALDNALRVYVADSEAASNYFKTCGASADPHACLTSHQDEYMAMAGHQQDLLAASEALVSETS